MRNDERICVNSQSFFDNWEGLGFVVLILPVVQYIYLTIVETDLEGL
jgi:hypothetical protein